MTYLEFGTETYAELIDHALEGSPEEVCGILGGVAEEDGSRVEALHPAENAAPRPELEYYIDPEEQLSIIESIEGDGLEVVGFYHSHPAGPTEPSATDVARATWPGLSYVIVVLEGRHPFVGAWRWSDRTETFTQELIRVRDSP